MLNKKITRWTKAHYHELRLVSMYVLGVSLFALLIHISTRIAGSDDTVFPIQSAPYDTVADWIHYRYHSWSGRIFAEAFVYIFSNAPLFLWKIASVVVYALSVAAVYGYAKLLLKTKSPQSDFLILGLALLPPYLIDPGVVFNGSLWVTGSMNYFWIVTFGLIGFYPILYYALRRHLPHWTVVTGGLIAGAIAACSQEQVGLVLVAFIGIFTAQHLYDYLKKNTIKFPFYLILILTLYAGLLLMGVLAPGNHIRVEQETATWLPDFYSVSLYDHINYGYRWLLDGIINHGGYLLVGLWGLFIALFVKKSKKDTWDKLVVALLIVMSVFTLAKGYGGLEYWFNFYATWKPSLPNKIASLAFIPWSVILATTIAAPLVLYRKNRKGILLSLVICASIASAAIITLSPTMYASGVRTLYIPSFILYIAVLLLSLDVIRTYKKISYLVIIPVVAIAASQYLLLILMIVNKA